MSMRYFINSSSQAPVGILVAFNGRCQHILIIFWLYFYLILIYLLCIEFPSCQCKLLWLTTIYRFFGFQLGPRFSFVFLFVVDVYHIIKVYCFLILQSLVAPDSFTHILRVLNTNVDGKQKIMYALTAIKGIGRRFSNICCKKAEVDLSKR